VKKHLSKLEQEIKTMKPKTKPITPPASDGAIAPAPKADPLRGNLQTATVHHYQRQFHRRQYLLRGEIATTIPAKTTCETLIKVTKYPAVCIRIDRVHPILVDYFISGD
jgi:hypothetical protein